MHGSGSDVGLSRIELLTSCLSSMRSKPTELKSRFLISTKIDISSYLCKLHVQIIIFGAKLKFTRCEMQDYQFL